MVILYVICMNILYKFIVKRRENYYNGKIFMMNILVNGFNYNLIYLYLFLEFYVIKIMDDVF